MPEEKSSAATEAAKKEAHEKADEAWEDMD